MKKLARKVGLAGKPTCATGSQAVFFGSADFGPAVEIGGFAVSQLGLASSVGTRLARDSFPLPGLRSFKSAIEAIQ
jgi:hypothetical protein